MTLYLYKKSETLFEKPRDCPCQASCLCLYIARISVFLRDDSLLLSSEGFLIIEIEPCVASPFIA